MQICTLTETHNHASIPSLSFLQAGCPSCRPTNSVNALKAVALNDECQLVKNRWVVFQHSYKFQASSTSAEHLPSFEGLKFGSSHYFSQWLIQQPYSVWPIGHAYTVCLLITQTENVVYTTLLCQLTDRACLGPSHLRGSRQYRA